MGKGKWRISGLHCLRRAPTEYFMPAHGNLLCRADDRVIIFNLQQRVVLGEMQTPFVRNSELCGQALIAYLQQKGFPQVAFRFVKDELTRFNLSLESGNIAIALESAKKIDQKDHRMKVMSQFHDALYLGDVREGVKILENHGHLPLACITAAVHRLKDNAERLAEELSANVPSLPKDKKASLLLPSTPILGEGDWPLLMATKGIFEGGLDATSNESQAKQARQILQAAENNMRDATQLINYDFRNPFAVCCATYLSIYRGHKDVT
ncbi:hypothetical protein HAX54_009125 [Datura stramonium]|uniref:Coatomer alpha subunit C-terminal domain-containing protein n=1 Tax=Datura stramonium TaxID=4076 RepID=A0ABS8RVX8_DATST|nr:hypothetical protein [Datura stramonium]